MLGSIKREIEIILKVTDKTGSVLTALKNRIAASLGVPPGAVGAAAAIGGIGLAAAAATIRLKSMVNEMIAMGDRLDDMSQRTGIAASALAEYEYMARRTGTTIEAVQMGIKGLAVSMGQVQRGAGEGADALRELGIRAADNNGQLREMTAVLDDIGSAFAGLSGQQRIDFAQRIFGRAGIQMVPILSQMERLQGLYRGLNPLTDEFARKAGDADDAIVDLKTAWAGLEARLSETVLPRITLMVQDLTRAISKAKGEAASVEPSMGPGYSTTGFTLPGQSMRFPTSGSRSLSAEEAQAFVQGVQAINARAAAEAARAQRALDQLIAKARELGITLQRKEFRYGEGVVVIDRTKGEEQVALIKEINAALNETPKLLEGLTAEDYWKEMGGHEGVRERIREQIRRAREDAQWHREFAGGLEVPLTVRLNDALLEERMSDITDRLRDALETMTLPDLTAGNVEEWRTSLDFIVSRLGNARAAAFLLKLPDADEANLEEWLESLDRITHKIEDAKKRALEFGEDFREQMRQTIDQMYDMVASSMTAMLGLGRQGEDMFRSLGEMLKSLAGQAFQGFFKFVLKSVLPFGHGGTAPLHAAAGLVVPDGPRGFDSVPAMLSPGEGVVRRDTMVRLERMLSAFENGMYISPYSLPTGGGGRVVNFHFNTSMPVSHSDGLRLAEAARSAEREYDRRFIK